MTGLSLATGRFWVGVVLLTVGGLMDTLDGAVAKAAGTSSRRGAFFDSVSDRVADAFIFAGLAWYFAAGPGHDPGLALLPVGILAVGNTISYERAKAESLGFVAKGGLMERAERLILLGLALLTHLLLVPLLWVSLGSVPLHRRPALRQSVATGERRPAARARPVAEPAIGAGRSSCRWLGAPAGSSPAGAPGARRAVAPAARPASSSWPAVPALAGGRSR